MKSIKFITYVLICSFITSIAFAQIVRLETNFGNIDIELDADAAPNTVANFLNYVNDGDFDNSVMHRVATDGTGAARLIQGGWIKFENDELTEIEVDDSIDNEFNLSNLRGTIAMAKQNEEPDSATSQWYVNVLDNETLDSSNGGFTVFGKVIRGMETVDLLNSLRLWNVPAISGTIPLLNYIGTGSVNDNLIIVNKAYVYEAGLRINSGLSGAWFNPDTGGQGILIEVLPQSNLVFVAWFTYDTQAPDAEAMANIGSPGHRWLTGLGTIDNETNSITIDITLTTGGLFDNSQSVVNSPANSYGTIILDFDDCENATINYNLTSLGLLGSFPMIRIAADNIVLCERLSLEAP